MRINKKYVLKLIYKKLKKQINLIDISSVINIFLMEFFKKLIEVEKIKINNFGTFKCKKRRSKRFWNVSKSQFEFCNGNYVLSFTLDEKIQRLILKNIT